MKVSAIMFAQLPGHSKAPVPTKKPRAKVACSRCRRLKTRCVNNDDGSPCEACSSKGYICEYTQVAPMNTTASPRTPTSIDSPAMNCLCNISVEHTCFIPPIPVGELSDAVNALGLENAQRYPGMRNPDDRNR